jgi:PAS domain S-box-containing protein
MNLRVASSAVSLAVGVTAAVAGVSALAAYLYSVHHFESLLETARGTGVAQGEMIRAALEHQMMEKDRTLIASMVESFGRQPHVENVMLLDRLGTVRYSSRQPPPGRGLDLGSPTCQACHRLPPDQRGSSRVIETGDGSVLRTVVPFRNRELCHRCHDPGQRVNGILLFDLNVGELRADMDRDLRFMVAGTGVTTLLIVGAVALVVRLAIVRRLQRVETTARRIASGDLAGRVPDEGSDTISWLAREFNTMADSVTGLLGEVRQQRERLETVINGIDDGIVVLDAQRRVLAANDAFLRRTGRIREQVLGSGCRDPDSGLCNMTDCPAMGCLQSGERQVRICERREADGRVRWEEVLASPIRNAEGELVQIVEVWRDISERRAAEARLAESHRLASLGMLASGFSHELNTPLATVLMCVEGILRDAQPNRERGAEWTRVHESAGIAREQVLRCRGITQHFLRLSRGQSSPGDIVDLPNVIASVARLVEPTARAHSVTAEVRPVAPGLRVRADEAELQHTLVNLLLNAIQACGPGGRVVLTAEAGDPVRIRLSDDGCGIAPEDQRRIFEPFVSLRKGGTGLGLFLSLNFIRSWGGDIVVDSAAGKGSTFEVRLPPLAGPAA